jgi:hypothetical protein
MSAHPSQSDYNKGGMLVFLGSVVFTLLFFVYISFFSGGIDLKEVKSKVPTEKLEKADKADREKAASADASSATAAPAVENPAAVVPAPAAAPPAKLAK